MANIAAKLSLNVPAITALCKGQPGTSLRYGIGAPTAGFGLSGDFYLDTTTYFIYGPKTTVWPSGVQLSYGALSGNWDATYVTVNNLSGSWNSTNSTVYSLSNNWNAVYTTVRAYSADNWETAYYQSESIFSYLQTVTSDLVPTKQKADDNFTTLHAKSGWWESVFSYTNTTSADTTTRLNDAFARTMSVFETVSALSGSWSADAGALAYTILVENSGAWYDTNTSVYENSARWENAWTTSNTLSTGFVDIAVLSGRWNSNFLTTSALSADWQSTTSTVNTYSASWGASITVVDVINVVQAGSANWNNTYNTVYTFSADTNFRLDALEDTEETFADFNFRTNNARFVPIVSNVLTFDLNTHRTFFTLVSADINAINLDNPTNCTTFTLLLSADGTTRNVVWPSRIVWDRGIPPERTTQANRTDIFTFISVNSGQKYFGTFVGSAYPAFP